MESNRIKCCLLVCHTLPLPAGNRALKSLEDQRDFGLKYSFLYNNSMIQGTLYSCSAEVFCLKNDSPCE